MAVAPLNLPGYAQSRDLDFSPLAQLGQVYQKASAERGVRDAFANGIPNDPAGLSQLGAQVGAYNPQLGLSLAQLGISASQRQQDQERQARQDAFQREESARAQRNSDRSFGLQQQQFDENKDYTPEERAGLAKQYGIDPQSPQGRAWVLTGALPEGNTTIQAQTEQRKAAAASNGLTPDNPGYQSFVLTGKMPREDAQPLTAGDKEAIRTADDAVLSNRSAIDSLNRAKTLSKAAFTGPTAGARGYAASFLGESSDTGKAGIATENLTNEVMTNALGQLKAIFGGNPTEGERKILLDLQGSVSKPDSVRQAIFDRAVAAAQKRLEFNQQRADQLRGNTYYKPNSGPKQGAPAQQQGDPLAAARDAIQRGADPAAVRQRLQQNGIDPSGL